MAGMTDLELAIQLAVEAHAGQTDKNGEPYILHPLRVMLAVAAPCRIAAVLHDVVEDGDFGLGDILALFGEETRGAVDALTRRGGESYEDFIVRCKANHIARHVKSADIRDNLRPGAPHLRDRYEAALMVLTEDD